MIKLFIITILSFFILGCTPKNSMNDLVLNLEERVLKESTSIDIETKLNHKWIQAKNKNSACKVYVEYDENNDHTINNNYSVYWDGECSNGYAKGLGREFEQGTLIDNESIVIYNNAPLEKPKYFYQKHKLSNIEILGEIDLGYKTFTINKDNKTLIRSGYFSKDLAPSYVIFKDGVNPTVYKKIYQNFDYEINYKKDIKEFSLFLNTKGKKLALNDSIKRNMILNEIMKSKDLANKSKNKAQIVLNQYKNKICKDYISVNFMDEYDYKSICAKQNQNVNTFIAKENIIDELDFLLQNTQNQRVDKDSYAVVLGIEDYLLESNVTYSKNSANMFTKYANKILGVPQENIWSFVKDRETSSGFIKAQWIDFLSNIPKDATIYFYYSGHGVPGKDGNAYILPSDTNAETIVLDKQFMLKNIYKNLNDTKAKKVIAFIDTCFSGKDDNGNLLFGGVAPILKHNPLKIENSKMTLLTAGGANEFSNQYKEKQHRLFSFFLMKGLAKGITNSEFLFKYIKRNVLNVSRKIGYSYKQIPEISGNKNINLR